MRAPRAMVGALAATALALVAGGCGDDEPYVADRDGTLRLTLDEYRISPQRIWTRSRRLELVGRNVGVLTHNAGIEAFEREQGEQPQEYVRTPTAHPGETVSATVTLRPGKYRVVCTLANHDNLGQYGELVVR